MSINKREEILSRVATLLSEIVIDQSGMDEIATVVRNRGLLEQDQCPAVALLDGDEDTRNVGDRRGRQKMSPAIVILHPQIFVLLKLAKPKNALVGQALNVYRGAIIKGIASDNQLLSLIGPNGDITYDGCETDLKTGMEMTGQMQLQFSISHVLDPYATA